jgi:hypothetical protein
MQNERTAPTRENEVPSRKSTLPLRDFLDRLGMDAGIGDHHAAMGAELERRMTTEAWSQASEFFSYTRKAHLDAAALTLARLLDKRHDAVTFRRLQRLIESEAGRFREASPDEVRKRIIPHVEEEINGLIKMAEPIKTRRDQLMAHNAQKQTLRNSEWMLEFSELERALGKAIALVNYLKTALEGSPTYMIKGAIRGNIAAELDRVMQPFSATSSET